MRHANTDLAPKRIAETVPHLIRAAPITAASLSACVGASVQSMTNTLRGLHARGLAESTGEGDTATWRWIGGSLLLPYADLTPPQRRLLVALRARGTSLAHEIAEVTHTPSRVVFDHLVTLESLGWVVRSERKPEPGARMGRVKVQADLSDVGRAALETAVPSTRSA